MSEANRQANEVRLNAIAFGWIGALWRILFSSFGQNQDFSPSTINHQRSTSSAVQFVSRKMADLSTSFGKKDTHSQSRPSAITLPAIPLPFFTLMRTFVLNLLALAMLTQCQKSAPVVWPELSALDSLAERAEGLVEKHDVKAMRTFVPGLAASAGKLVAKPVPANAADPAATELLRSDLKDLMSKLADPAKLSDADLESFVAGVHPIVEQLMVKSGMPHVHESSPK